MIDCVTRAAFADELEKIAGAGELARKALWAGWHGLKPDLSAVPGSSWRAGSGKITKWLPGGKAMTLGTAALQMPSVLAKEDPTGKGHSRLERAARMAGSTVGGIAGSGLMMGTRFGQKNPILGMIAGNVLGGSAGSKVLSAPFAEKRLVFGKR